MGNMLLGEYVTIFGEAKDIDWGKMKSSKIKRVKKQWNECEKRKLTKEKFEPYWEYRTGANDTKETYIARNSSIAPFAVLHGNEWYEKGTMGWFGISTGDKEQDTWGAEFEDIIKTLKPDDELTLVDVHI